MIKQTFIALIVFSVYSKGICQTTFQYDQKGNQTSASFTGDDPCGGGTEPPIDITIDGNVQEWADINTLSTNGSSGLNFLKVYDDCQYIYVYANGTFGDHFQVFIDADFNTTGSNEWLGWIYPSTGISFMSEDAFPYAYTGTGEEWSWNQLSLDQELLVINNDKLEFRIPKSQIANLGTNINLGFVRLDVVNENWEITGKIPNADAAVSYALQYSEGCGNCTTDDLSLNGSMSTIQNYETGGKIESTQIIESTANVVYDAGNEINLKAGFWTKNGAQFSAYIDGCNASLMTVESRGTRMPHQPTPANNFQSLADFSVFPNPFNQQFTVSLQIRKEGKYDLHVYNVLGARVAHPIQHKWLEKGDYNIEVTTNKLNALLIVQLSNGSGLYSNKMIVQIQP